MKPSRACCMLTLIWNLLKKPSIANCSVSDRLNANKLTLNAKRSNYVIFRPYQRKLNYSVNIEMIDNCTQIPTTLQCKDHVKYLGVLLDSNLSWKFQINNVALKISRTVGVVAHLRHFVPRTTLLNIYQSLIFFYLTYQGRNKVYGIRDQQHKNGVGSGLTAPGSGITSRGIGISITVRGSGIRFSDITTKTTKFWNAP